MIDWPLTDSAICFIRNKCEREGKTHNKFLKILHIQALKCEESSLSHLYRRNS